MEIVLLMLLNALLERRRRSYSPEQLEAVARERSQQEAQQGLPPTLSAPRRPYRWWRYEGLW